MTGSARRVVTLLVGVALSQTFACGGSVGAAVGDGAIGFNGPTQDVTSGGSVSGTSIPAARKIVDSRGVVWTLRRGKSYENGVADGGVNIAKLLYFDGSVYALNSASQWWVYSNGWTPAAGNPVVESANGTVVPGANQIVDSRGIVWAVKGGYSFHDGVTDAGANCVQLVYYGGSVYGETTNLGWFVYSNGWQQTSGDPRGWAFAGADPRGQVNPPAPPPPSNPPTSSGGITFGINAHPIANPQVYTSGNTEQIFQLLQANNLHSYRLDVGSSNPTNDFPVLDRLVALGAQYGVTIRPMLYLPAQNQSIAASAAKQYAYAYAQRYAHSIPVWELGNELDGDAAHADVNTTQMRDMATGIQQAGQETGEHLMSAINIMSTCGGTDPCTLDGDLWFLDVAARNGFRFDIVTFHYYSAATDGAYWHGVMLGQARKAAETYGVKVFLNEANCAEHYTTGDDGNSTTCAQALQSLYDEVKANYSDVITEVDTYELLDEPNRQGVEAHFGLFFDLQHPKRTWSVVTAAAQ